MGTESGSYNLVQCASISETVSELVLSVCSQWCSCLWATWPVGPPVRLYQQGAVLATRRIPAVPGAPHAVAWTPPSSPALEVQLEASHATRGSKFPCTKVASTWLVPWWALITCPTQRECPSCSSMLRFLKYLALTIMKLHVLAY